ncbi:hypothetical protein B1H18_28555 [Streptomyces tsukubensis]|uniref:Uncharacterized protein n=2 Tax=Streptomyces tsukubensis TaxID=83656 RepID=A0A1V4A1Y8_9ACTN|nr:hypothetical protein B1H18_28555 [Streptomyces tsukubensis]
MRHGVAALGAFLGTLVMLRQVLVDIEEWWNNWARGGTAVSGVLFSVGLPITAAFACWLGGSDARQHTDWLGATAARRPLPRVMMAVAPAVLWPLGGYLLVVAVVGFTLTNTESRSSAPLDAITSDIAVQTMVACLGHALGRATSLRLAAPLVWLLTAGCLNFLEDGLVSTAYPQSYIGPGVRGLDELYFPTPPKWLPWLVAAAFLVLAAAALFLCARHRRLAALCLTVTVPLLIWVAAISHTPDGGVIYRAAPDRVPLECTGSKPHICVADDTSAPVATDPGPVEEVAERLAGVPGAPTHYVLTYGRSDDGIVTAEPESARGPGWWTVTMSAEQFNEYTLYNIPYAIAQEPDPECALWHLVASWVLPPRFRDKSESAEAARLDALSGAQRRAWLSDYFSGNGCVRPPQPSNQAKDAP